MPSIKLPKQSHNLLAPLASLVIVISEVNDSTRCLAILLGSELYQPAEKAR